MPSFSEEIIKERLYRAQADLLFASEERMLEIVRSLQSMEPGDVRVGRAAKDMIALIKKGNSPAQRLQELQREMGGDSLSLTVPASISEEPVGKEAASEEPVSKETAPEKPVSKETAPVSKETASEEVHKEYTSKKAAPEPTLQSKTDASQSPEFSLLSRYWSSEELALIFGSSPATVARWKEGKSQSILNQKKTALILQALNHLGEKEGKVWVNEKQEEISSWRKGEAPLTLRIS